MSLDFVFLFFVTAMVSLITDVSRIDGCAKMQNIQRHEACGLSATAELLVTNY